MSTRHLRPGDASSYQVYLDGDVLVVVVVVAVVVVV